ncbi:MAG TPA: glycolate oxidase subunit GlcE, partial [Paracoccaceae bacterium]|nr:glycolate oxidase subunit GlcE [Paracoccaceae bacterium]
ERLKDLLGRFGAVTVSRDEGANAEAWAHVRDARLVAEGAGDVWRISVKPSDAPEIAARLQADGLLYDWGGGLIWALMPAGTDARAKLGAFIGHATLIRASAETRAALDVFQPEAAPVRALSDGLRRKFDPRGILNPGLMG